MRRTRLPLTLAAPAMVLACLLATAPAQAQSAGTGAATSTTDSPELTVCKSTALIALQQRSPSVKDIIVDAESLSISKADTTVGDTSVRTILIGDAYVERRSTNKPHRFLCLIGEKGKVLLTFLSPQ